MSKHAYRLRLGILLAVSLFFIGVYYYYQLKAIIPDHITIEAGSENFLQLSEEPEVYFQEEVVQTLGSSAVKIPKNAVHIEMKNKDVSTEQSVGTYNVQCKFLGFLELKNVQVDVIKEQEVYPGGFPVGIYVETKGILVIGSGSITGMDGLQYEPAKNIMQSGDYITSINGKRVTTKEEFIQTVNEEGGNPVILGIKRNGEESKVKLTPVKTGKDEYRLGIWIRDNTQGVGMLTFVTKEGKFGALGHGITDVDTGLLMNIEEGRVLDTEIISVVKGKSGSPGELVGMIDYREEYNIGNVSDNTLNGIFGNIDEDVLCNFNIKPMKIALKQDIETGPAVIRTNIDGEMKEYDIEILEIDLNCKEENKSFLLEVTDEELIEKTGGIVQGMSGSPVIQNGKLVGAVTHVLVNDPTKGYAIFIENMLETANQVAEEQAKKDAS